MLYVIGLGWMLLVSSDVHDPFIYVAQAILLVVPMFFFGVQCLRDSGAMTMRRARSLAAGLAARRYWPVDLMECRLLPEVKAFRESLHIDATPALSLLAHPSPAVRVAALAALEYRLNWRRGQPEVVLQLAQRATEPEVRASAVNALANLDDRNLIEPLAELMRDQIPMVRQVTYEALLWDSERRWPWIRHIVRLTLADPALEEDGPLRLSSSWMTPEVIADLHGWTAEKGVLALRAALTLGVSYGKQLAGGGVPELAAQLRKQLSDPRTPAMWRLELARLLYEHRELSADDLRRLLDASLPAPVRLIAVEALLAHDECPEAVSVLHDLARLPNREIALATAQVIQKRLGIDLGLPAGKLPNIHSRIAADVARRVMFWATQHDVDPTPLPRDPHGAHRAQPTSHVDL
jgi:HEAT repeat protein